MALDPIDLQVVTGALRAACEEMGAALVRSAHSANIKERRDCSSGLFDAAGQMVMQAEHIPVHLGAMPAAVAAVLGEDHSDGRPWILNDPFRGGTHLPDITVITPVLDEAGSELLGFAANRAHHADVGGRVPGSMPADSTTLDEEGVVIAPRVLDEAAIDELVAQMRQPAQRRADLRAQLAANRIGARRLRELAARLGAGALREATAAVLDYAERRTRACIAALPDGPREARDVLEGIDGDIELRLVATVDGDRLVLDFAGSAGQHRGNLNCPLAVTRSAAYFAVRVLTDPDVPPSAGAYRPIEVRAPAGLAAQRARAAGRSRAGGRGRQRRDLQPRRRPRARRVRARARAGHDEQPHAGNGGVHVLRDARRRPGRLPGRRRAERRPRRDVQHAQHAGRGARARVPAARRAPRDPARIGRRRAPQRRRRDRPRARGAGADVLRADHRAPPPRSPRRRRRRARRARAQPAQRRRAAREGDRRARGRRPPGDRDAGRRRARTVERSPATAGACDRHGRRRPSACAASGRSAITPRCTRSCSAATTSRRRCGRRRTAAPARPRRRTSCWHRTSRTGTAKASVPGCSSRPARARFAGHAGLRCGTVGGAPSVEVLYAVSPDRWGRGYASEMALAAVDRARALGLPGVVGYTLTTNHASQRVLEKAGLRFERTLEHAGLPHWFGRLSFAQIS